MKYKNDPPISISCIHLVYCWLYTLKLNKNNRSCWHLCCRLQSAVKELNSFERLSVVNSNSRQKAVQKNRVAGQEGLRVFIGLTQCPSRKSTNGPLQSVKIIFVTLFWLKCASTHSALSSTPDGKSISGQEYKLNSFFFFLFKLQTLQDGWWCSKSHTTSHFYPHFASGTQSGNLLKDSYHFE